MPRFSRLATSTVAAAAVLLTAASAAAADPPPLPASPPEPTFPAQTAPAVAPDEPLTLPMPSTPPATWEPSEGPRRQGRHSARDRRAQRPGPARGDAQADEANGAAPSGRHAAGPACSAPSRPSLRPRQGLLAVPFVAMDVSRDALDALQRVLRRREHRRGRAARTRGSPAPAGVTSNQNLNDWWDIYQTRTDTAWNNGYDGNGQTIGVLDTGTQAGHPWLAGKVVREACYSVDHRRQLVSAAARTGATRRPARARPSRAPTTRRARTARTWQPRPRAPMGWRARRTSSPCRCSTGTRHGEPRTWSSDQLWGLKYVYDLRGTHSIASVNLSLGGGKWTGYCDGYDSEGTWQGTSSGASTYFWIAYLRAAGIATVMSSGNDNYTNAIGAPACNSNAVSVGNTTLDTFGNDAVFFGNNTAREAERLQHLQRPLRAGAGHRHLQRGADQRVECGGPGPRWPRPTSPARSPRSSSFGLGDRQLVAGRAAELGHAGVRMGRDQAAARRLGRADVPLQPLIEEPGEH